MIDAGERLVVFVDDAADAPSTLLPLWRFAWATRSDFHQPEEMNCAVAREDAKSPLPLVFHFSPRRPRSRSPKAERPDLRTGDVIAATQRLNGLIP
jgi:hypothetical protein